MLYVIDHANDKWSIIPSTSKISDDNNKDEDVGNGYFTATSQSLEINSIDNDLYIIDNHEDEI